MRWLIAAGGTGGHVFPALSVAMALREREKDAQIVFLGTQKGLESRAVVARGFPLRTVHASGLMGLGWMSKIRTLLGLPVTFVQCLGILAAFRPDVVLGMGGFVAGPVVLLAALLRLPVAIAEQNAVAGRTNRILGRFVGRIFVTFPESTEAFPRAKVRLAGNPVRAELLQEAQNAHPPSWQGLTGEMFHLLVFGGSQGARGIDRLMVEALPYLRDLPFPLEIMHQARAADIPALGEAYASSAIAHQLLPFIEEMAQAYTWAHLVICRAGATSLAEIALFKRPSILIPFPHATDDHQARNAGVFESAGAALMFRQGTLTGEKLARILKTLAGDPERLRRMGESAADLARPDAAERILEGCMQLVGRRKQSHG